MARYLTPAKIGLLALVELYTEEAVPSEAVLPVLSFITAHLLDHDSTDPSSSQQARWMKAERAVSLVITIKDFEKLLGSYPFLMGMPGRKLWDQFLGKLWDINSLDALNEFFDRIIHMLSRTKDERRKDGEDDPEDVEAKMKLSRNSPLGAFIRRSRLEYQRLRFHDCAELWKAFVRYRQPTAHYLRRKNPNFGRLSFDSVLLLGEQEDWDPESVSALAAVAYGDMLTGDESSTIPVSTDDVESLLEFQIEQMQSKDPTLLFS
jgi:anaphase-promoting complex subunit 5